MIYIEGSVGTVLVVPSLALMVPISTIITIFLGLFIDYSHGIYSSGDISKDGNIFNDRNAKATAINVAVYCQADVWDIVSAFE